MRMEAKIPTVEDRDKLFDSTSDFVKHTAKRLMQVRRISELEFDVKTEDFDKAFERQCEKYWEKYKNASRVDMAIIGLSEMLEDEGLEALDRLFGGVPTNDGR